MTTMETSPPVAHNHERPPRFGDWFCDCAGCRVALEVTAGTDPGLPVVVKRACGRTVLSVGTFVAVYGCDAHRLCEGAGDYVREVFVGRDELRSMVAGAKVVTR